MEKISANSDTRFSVKPQAQEANSVAASVSITATPTIAASRRPSVDQHQRDHRQRGEEQLLDQLHRLVVGGLAVVARDRDLDALGNHRVLQFSTRATMRSATSTAFSPGFLVTAMRDRREFADPAIPLRGRRARCRARRSAPGGRGAVDDFGDIRKIDRAAVRRRRPPARRRPWHRSRKCPVSTCDRAVVGDQRARRACAALAAGQRAAHVGGGQARTRPAAPDRAARARRAPGRRGSSLRACPGTRFSSTSTACATRSRS